MLSHPDSRKICWQWAKVLVIKFTTYQYERRYECETTGVVTEMGPDGRRRAPLFDIIHEIRLKSLAPSSVFAVSKEFYLDRTHARLHHWCVVEVPSFPRAVASSGDAAAKGRPPREAGWGS